MTRACLAQSAIAGFLPGFLIAAPIGDTTVLLLFSFSLEMLLALMLMRERRSRLGSGSRRGGSKVVTPFRLLVRTAPHLRARRVVVVHSFVTTQSAALRWRTGSRKATS